MMENKQLDSGVRQNQTWIPALPLLPCFVILGRLLMILFSSRIGKTVAPAPPCCGGESSKVCATFTHLFPVHLLGTS